jgi:sugar phosphate isomerase/epimerase
MNKKLEIFVNSWIFGNVQLDEIVKRVAALGFDGIELVGEPGEYQPKRVNALARDFGIRICSICGMHPGPNPDDLRALCHADANERQKAVDYVMRCIDLAKEVGARSVLVVPSLVGQPGFFASREKDTMMAVESIGRAGEYARKQQIYLTIEPINRYEVGLVNSIYEALDMAWRIENDFVKIMGDTFHMQIEEGDGIANAIRRAGGDWLYHLHAADNTREAPGRGTMDWKEILRALYDIEYTGVISLEPLPKGSSPYDARKGNIPAEKLDAELKFALGHLRQQQLRVLPYAGE